MWCWCRCGPQIFLFYICPIAKCRHCPSVKISDALDNKEYILQREHMRWCGVLYIWSCRLWFCFQCSVTGSTFALFFSWGIAVHTSSVTIPWFRGFPVAIIFVSLLPRCFPPGGKPVPSWHGRKLLRKDHDRGCLESDVTLPDEKLSCAHASLNSAY